MLLVSRVIGSDLQQAESRGVRVGAIFKRPLSPVSLSSSVGENGSSLSPGNQSEAPSLQAEVLSPPSSSKSDLNLGIGL